MYLVILHYLYFLFHFHIDIRVLGCTCIIKMWPNKSVVEHSVKLCYEMSFFPIKKFQYLFILLITFSAISSLDITLSNTHLTYLSCECCFKFTCLYLTFSWHLTFSWQIFSDLHLLAKRIDLVLSSPKCILSLLPTNQSQILSKSLLSCFSISSTSLYCYKMHESSAYKSEIDMTACGIPFT